MNIHTVQFAHMLESGDLQKLHDFLSRTAFVISHKNESIETLLKVIWYIPISSPTIVVTNCPEREREDLATALKTRMAHHQKLYLVHQKDESLAHLFNLYGVSHILGDDGKVVNGKGEGMYIGTLCAYQLNYPQWIIFYDADNFVPSALLEYTMAMSKIFMSTPSSALYGEDDTLLMRHQVEMQGGPDLHNVRICWASKPEAGKSLETRIMGRTTRVVSPLFESLLEGWFGIRDQTISSSNAGEQGMSLKTAISLRFSSGFSVETFQLLDLFFKAVELPDREVIFEQYLSKSPHFHEKKGDEHIKKMIEESLGCFFHFEPYLPSNVQLQLQQMFDDLQLELLLPMIYPPLLDLPVHLHGSLIDQFRLFHESDYQDMLVGETGPMM